MVTGGTGVNGLTKEIMTLTVFGNLILRILRFYFSIFSLILVSIEKIYQTLKTVSVVSIFNFLLRLSCLMYYVTSGGHTSVHFDNIINNSKRRKQSQTKYIQ